MVYKLSATLAGHTSDVRGVVGPSPSRVLSVSRDCTAISWTRGAEVASFKLGAVFSAGSRYINSVTYIPPQADAPAGYIVTGGQDTVINVFSLEEGAKPDPVYSLVGHGENVCALDARPDGTIISGSWDRTARVWVGFQPAFELKGHAHNVWAVLAIEDDGYLTGSADKTIKLWKSTKVAHTYSGHSDVVRGLTRLPNIGFASCANDSEIIVWTLGGDIVHRLSGHTSFVYSLCTLPSGDLVSSGEDRSARIWKDGDVAQTITHPAISVWSVAAMPNGDIVTGASDGNVRVFSESSERWASEEDLKSWDDELARQALPSQQIGDIKKSDLPGLEALGQQGKKDGQNLMIRNGDKVEVYQWSTATATWQKIGDVVDAPGSNRRQIYDGREYDFVFDVDIQEGVPPLKLPYNAAENPYMAAQKFLEKNNLPLTYLDEVVRFIEKNTGGVTLGPNTSEFVDPYTGASSYRAGTAPSTGGGGGGSGDPFTGGSSYRTAQAGPAPEPVRPKPKLLPITTALSFKQANLTAMQSKILQLNDTVATDPTLASQVLAPEETGTLDTIFTFLTAAAKEPAFDPSVQQQLDNLEIELLTSILERWDDSRRFPVLDLLRLVCAYSPGAFGGDGEGLRMFRSVLTAADWSADWSAPLSKTRETNSLLALRAVANASQWAKEEWVAPVLAELAKARYAALGKNHRVALATIVFNLSVLASKGQTRLVGPQVLEVLGTILQNEVSEPEAAYRALVALGNLAVVAAKTGSQSTLKAALVAGTTLSGKFKEPRFSDIAVELRALAR